MTPIYFITGTDTGVGKTVLTALLAAGLRQRGVRVAALKPVSSGGRADARLLRRALGGSLALRQINPWHFPAPIAPVLAAERVQKELRRSSVTAYVRAMGKDFEVLLVEGAGGLLSPLGVDFNSRDLISVLGAVPLIVAANRLGAVNEILLTLEALPARRRASAGVVLMAPPRASLATRLNEVLLRRLSVSALCQLPWFGPEFSLEAALRRTQTRRMLNDVLQGFAIARHPN